MWQMDDAHRFYSHMRPIEVRAEFDRREWDFDDYFKFTFVRNPWARLVSLYSMVFGRRNGLRSRVKRRTAEFFGHHPSPRGFRRWVRTVATDGRGGGGPDDQRWQRYGTYALGAYVGDGRGNELVDRVVRLEDIDTALPRVLAEIGLPPDSAAEIPIVNAGGRTNYRRYYDPATVDYVGSLYRDDIERFGYAFEGEGTASTA